MKKSNYTNNKKHSKPRNYKKNSRGGMTDRNPRVNGEIDDPTMRSSTHGSTNDVAWYSRNPELLASVARIPYPYKPGMRYKINDAYEYVPGVCAIEYWPSLGTNDSYTDPINVAAKEFYGRVRSKFSGSLDADAPDMMMYALALADIHAYLGYCRRLYRLLNNYSSTNYNYPITVLTALGFSTNTIDDMVKRKVEIWGQINSLTHMANKWLVPDDMPLFSRKQWLTENVFMDEPTAGGQTFIFRPLGFWRIFSDAETGTSLSIDTLITTSWDSVYNYGLNLINSLSEMDESYTINGYFQRSFEGTNWLQSPLLGADEKQDVMYDSAALSQIENATIMSMADQFSPRNIDIYIEQDPSTNLIKTRASLIVEEGLDDQYVYKLYDLPLNLHIETPTAADTVEATRLRAIPDENYDEVAGGYVLDCGTEICMAAKFYFRPGTYNAFSSSIYVDSDTDPYNIDNAFKAAGMWTSFQHAPMFAFRYALADVSGSALYANISNIALPSMDDYRNLHRVCLYSLFNCFR